MGRPPRLTALRGLHLMGLRSGSYMDNVVYKKKLPIAGEVGRRFVAK